MDCCPDLTALLAPLTVEEFASTYWQKLCVLIKGDRDKLARLIPGGFSSDDFFQSTSKGADLLLDQYRLAAHNTAGFDNSNGEYPASPIQPSRAPAAWAAGQNIQVSNPHDPRLSRLISKLKTQLAHAGKCYVSGTVSPAGFGWPYHFDPVDTFVIQCEGRKIFRVSNGPHIPHPPGVASFDRDGRFVGREETPHSDWAEVPDADATKFSEHMLEPGDVFFLPAGVVHGTRALDPTVTLLFNFRPVSPLDLLTDVLRSRLAASDAWRYVPEAVGRRPDGQLPPTLRAFLAERISELRDAVSTLTPESLTAEWARGVAFPGHNVLAGDTWRAPSSGSEIQPRDELTFNRHIPVSYVIDEHSKGAERIRLFFGATELEGEGDLFWFLKGLIQRDRFTAEEAGAWVQIEPCPWEVTRDRLATLLEHGLIARRDPRT